MRVSIKGGLENLQVLDESGKTVEFASASIYLAKGNPAPVVELKQDDGRQVTAMLSEFSWPPPGERVTPAPVAAVESAAEPAKKR